MGLLEDAASSWKSLADVQYYMLLGRKQKWSGNLILTFTSESFAHLTGLHYADDVDLGVNN